MLQPIQSIVTTDMTGEALHMFATLMITQANSVVYEKGVKSKMGRSLLAKLAKRVATDYGEYLAAVACNIVTCYIGWGLTGLRNVTSILNIGFRVVRELCTSSLQKKG